MISDEIVYKIITKKRVFEEDDLLTYLMNRSDDHEFFHLSDWPTIARLLGYQDYVKNYQEQDSADMAKVSAGKHISENNTED